MKIKIFSFIWRRWLKFESIYGKVYTNKVIKITGWRSAIIQKCDGTRSRQTFIFDWEWKYFLK